ncbi:MAG: hypothetical protein AAF598_00990 [Bacteroidota bacterium]
MNHILSINGKFLLGLALFNLTYFIGFAQAENWVPIGHAHNDYQRDQPLVEALAAGFPSIEIDLFLHKGKVKVSHYGILLGSKPDFEVLYLQPVAHLIRSNGGLVAVGDSTQLIYMLDLKTNPAELYKALHAIFANYTDLFQTKDKWGPILLMNSGKRDLKAMSPEQANYWLIDGQAASELSLDPAFVPRMSYSYKKHFSWKGKEEMPSDEYELLCKMVDEAHYQNKKIRFWASPDQEAVWETLLGAGVDWVNVDDLQKFRKFYFSRLNDPAHSKTDH